MSRPDLEPSILQYVRRLPLSPFMTKSGQLANRAPAILKQARNLADVVIVEVPPLLALHHAEALMHVVDVVLVVAESKSAAFDDARHAGDLLRRMGAPVLGVVLTNVPLNQRDVRQLALPRPVEPPAGETPTRPARPSLPTSALCAAEPESGLTQHRSLTPHVRCGRSFLQCAGLRVGGGDPVRTGPSHHPEGGVRRGQPLAGADTDHEPGPPPPRRTRLRSSSSITSTMASPTGPATSVRVRRSRRTFVSSTSPPPAPMSARSSTTDR